MANNERARKQRRLDASADVSSSQPPAAAPEAKASRPPSFESLNRDCLHHALEFFKIEDLFVLRACSSWLCLTLDPHANHEAFMRANSIFGGLRIKRALMSPRMTLQGAKFLHRLLTPTKAAVWTDAYEILKSFCGRGQIELAEWFLAKFNIPGMALEDFDGAELLLTACESGNRAMAEWVDSTFDVYISDEAESQRALDRIVTSGHTTVAAWFTSIHQDSLWEKERAPYKSLSLRRGLTSEQAQDIRAFEAKFEAMLHPPPPAPSAKTNRGLRLLTLACSNGHVGMARWLVDTFGLTAADVCVRHNGLLWELIGAGHYRTNTASAIRWLMQAFAVTAAGLQAPGADDPPQELRLIEWLLERPIITSDDLKTAAEAILRHLRYVESGEYVRYFQQTFMSG